MRPNPVHTQRRFNVHATSLKTLKRRYMRTEKP